jgi:hypothetical protein
MQIADRIETSKWKEDIAAAKPPKAGPKKADVVNMGT